ncbi:MAG: DUF2147 domain-containing protein [Nitrospiraceae bacterium]|nr:DUF2147 domain-containing protein [Nitrospiraceae bacterium]
MKNIIKAVLLAFLIFSASASAADKKSFPPNAVAGTWLTQNRGAKIEIYKAGKNVYMGRMVWLREPFDEKGRPLTDAKNPDPALRGRPYLGMVIIKTLSPAGENRWEGRIYDPESGKTYNCTVSLENEDTLRLRGYLGIPLLGRTETWRRVS